MTAFLISRRNCSNLSTLADVVCDPSSEKGEQTGWVFGSLFSQVIFSYLRFVFLYDSNSCMG